MQLDALFWPVAQVEPWQVAINYAAKDNAVTLLPRTRQSHSRAAGNLAVDTKQFTLHGTRLVKGHDDMRARFMTRFAEPDAMAKKTRF